MTHNAASLDDKTALGQAAEWFAVLRDENATDADRKRWRAWLPAHPAHERAWQRVEAISQPFAQLGRVTPSSDAARNALDAACRQSRRRALGGLLGVAGLAAGAGILGKSLLPWQSWWYQAAAHTASLRTAVGEIRAVQLEDGSELTLGTDTAVDIAFDGQLRRILLRSGEIFIATAQDTRTPARQLVVDTGHGRITALGTRFSVRSDIQQASTAVFQGAVRIQPTRGQPLDLTAGQQTDFNADTTRSPQTAQPAREAWARGVLVADDVRLDDFIADLARYTDIKLEVASDVAELRLVGVYRFGHPERDLAEVLRAVEEALPVRVEQPASARRRIAGR